MVEDFWRSYLLLIRDLQAKYPRDNHAIMKQCMEFSQRAFQRFEAIAALMPPDQGTAFARIIQEEDNVCSNEHHFQPDALYRRLNLNLRALGSKRDQDAGYRKLGLDPAAIDAAIASGDDVAGARAATAVMARMESQPPPAAPRRQRQGIGEMAFRTAVRATIWELIASLFRR
jgi:hypothetical protein